MIWVSGYSWCPEPKQIGLGSMTAKILCRTHNEALSPFDAEAAKLARALQVFDGLGSARLPSRMRIRGWRIEAWLAKTMVNLAVQVGTPIAQGFFDPSAVVRYAFGLQRFQPPEGLYYRAVVNDEVGGRPQSVSFQPMIETSTGRIGGASFTLHGHRLLLRLPDGPTVDDGVQPVRRLVSRDGKARVDFRWRDWRDRIGVHVGVRFEPD